MQVGSRKDLPRLASNFSRLGLNLGMGLILVPVLFKWLGNDWFGLYNVILSAIGLAQLFEDVTRTSMVRELARSFHARDPGEFKRVYATGIALACAAAVVSVVLFAGLWFLIPQLNIRPEMIGPARTFLVAQAITSVLSTIQTPINNMFVVTFRFVSDNTWQVVRRASYIISACVCAFVLRIQDPAEGFRAFVIGANLLSVACIVAATIQLISSDRRLIPDMRQVDFQTLRTVWPTVMWNSLVNLAMNFYERTTGVMMNHFFGLHGSAIWGPSLQLASYVRMASLGVNGGIEAVSAKIAVEKGERSTEMKSMVRHAAVLHAVVSLAAFALILGLPGPLVRLWIGNKVESPAISLPQIIILTQILLIPVTARAISDCWTRILYGAGFVSRYAKLVLLGGVLNPIVTFSLLSWAPLPEHLRIYVPAIGFAAVFFLFHFILLPRVAGKCFDITLGAIYQPIVRPALAAGLSMVYLVLVTKVVHTWNLITLVAVCLGYAVVFGVCMYTVGMTASQRRAVRDLLPHGTSSTLDPD